MSFARRQNRGTASRDRKLRRLIKSRVVGPTSSRAANALVEFEREVEVDVGTVGALYETIVRRQGVTWHKRVGKIDLAWFHELHKQWRRMCRSTS
jgi:hypothetical protein